MKLQFEQEVGDLFKELQDQRKIALEKANQLEASQKAKFEAIKEQKSIQDFQYTLQKQLDSLQADNKNLKKLLAAA